MQPSTEHLLRAVRRTIQERLAPELSGTDAAALLAPLDVAMNELIRRARSDEASDNLSRAALDEVIARGRSLVGERPDDAAASGSPMTEAVAVLDRVHEMLEGNCSEAFSKQASEWIIEVVQAQHADAMAQLTPIPEDSLAAEPEYELDVEALRKRLGAYLGREAVSLGNIRTLSGGFSRTTLLEEWSQGQDSGEIVLRKQKRDGLLDGIGLSVAQEYPLLSFARAQGLPVPGMLWLEEDTSVGGPYIAMERAPGSVLGSSIGAEGVDEDVLRNIARTVAQLHTAPWEERGEELAGVFGLDPQTVTIRKATERLLDMWEKFWDHVKVDPSPALTAAFYWLRRNVPDSDARPCLTHGDLGFHNILFQGKEVSALLDWESAFLADPAKDMALCEGFVSRYTDWSRFVAWYHEAGGLDFDSSKLEFYHVLDAATHVLVAEMGWQTRFAHQASPPIEPMLLGGPIRQHFFTDYMKYLPVITRL